VHINPEKIGPLLSNLTAARQSAVKAGKTIVVFGGNEVTDSFRHAEAGLLLLCSSCSSSSSSS
jgi:ribosomal protein L7Ae-like RNA K-turn-binding protein